jgi:hypothetical protein
VGETNKTEADPWGRLLRFLVLREVDGFLHFLAILPLRLSQASGNGVERLLDRRRVGALEESAAVA